MAGRVKRTDLSPASECEHVEACQSQVFYDRFGIRDLGIK